MDDRAVFYGEKLRLARLLHGYTQQQLGEKVLVSRQFIHQLEGDDRSPADDVLDALVEVLQVRKDFFFKPILNDVKMEQCHFRKRKTTPVGLANRVLAYSSLFEQLTTLFHEHVELPEPTFPTVKENNATYTFSEIDAASIECRKLWGLGDGPISNLTRVLERAGVLITNFQSIESKIDALSLNRRYPIIVRNEAKKSICRYRFDLAHECGHFVLHDGIETGDNVTEAEADKFASLLLFPRKSFIKEFPDFKGRRLDWNEIYRLKIRWGVSVRAIIYMAHQYERITSQQNRSSNVYLNKTGQSKVEWYEDKVRNEQPEMLQEIFQLLDEQKGMKFEFIADHLNISSELLSVITGYKPVEDKFSSNIVPFISK